MKRLAGGPPGPLQACKYMRRVNVTGWSRARANYLKGDMASGGPVLAGAAILSGGSLHEFSEILGFPKIWEPNSSFWEPNPKFWEWTSNLVFFISEVDAELPFALRKISFKRVGVRSGVA